MRYDLISPNIVSLWDREVLLVKRTSLCLDSPVISRWDFSLPRNWSTILVVRRVILPVSCAEAPVSCNYVEIIMFGSYSCKIGVSICLERVHPKFTIGGLWIISFLFDTNLIFFRISMSMQHRVLKYFKMYIFCL